MTSVVLLTALHSLVQKTFFDLSGAQLRKLSRKRSSRQPKPSKGQKLLKMPRVRQDKAKRLRLQKHEKTTDK